MFYDRSGNLLTLDHFDSSSVTTPSESLSYSYSGPKCSTWTYDAHANVTADPQGGVSITWNVLDLPRTITSGSGTSSVSTQRGYLSDGSGREVWRMSIDRTVHAGGALKNRLQEDTLRLPAGRYMLRYSTDESHSAGHWDDTPPDDPFSGIKLYSLGL